MDVCGEAVEVLDGGGVDLVDYVVVKDQPEPVTLHYGNVMAPGIK